MTLIKLTLSIPKTTKPRSENRARKFYLNKFLFFLHQTNLGGATAERNHRKPHDFPHRSKFVRDQERRPSSP